MPEKSKSRKFQLDPDQRDAVLLRESGGVTRVDIRLPLLAPLPPDGAAPPGTREPVAEVEKALAGDADFLRCRELAAKVAGARQEVADLQARLERHREERAAALALPAG